MRKYNDIKLNEYFGLWEFECPCCHRVMLTGEGLYILTELRIKLDVPIHISKGGGYRCKEYNEKVGGHPNSSHLIAEAYDILNPTAEMWEQVKRRFACGYWEIKRGFIHCQLYETNALNRFIIKGGES